MNDADIMARTMYGEARNQGIAGLKAIANVIMNRVARKTWFGATPAMVCLKPAQFSCWNVHDANLQAIKAVTDEDGIFKIALNFAQLAIANDLADITDGATHYRVIGTRASWDPDNKLVPCATIGRHEFFNNVP